MGHHRHFAVFAVEIEAEGVGAGGDGEGWCEAGFCFFVYCFIAEAAAEFTAETVASCHDFNLAARNAYLQGVGDRFHAMLFIKLFSHRIGNIITRVEPVGREASLRTFGSSAIEGISVQICSVEKRQEVAT